MHRFTFLTKEEKEREERKRDFVEFAILKKLLYNKIKKDK